jgi:lipoic acid synthetase
MDRLPSWFRQPAAPEGQETAALLGRLGLHTICESARCPNGGDCFARHTATFLVLGDTCTRRCTFCAVNKGAPAPVDEGEPEQLALAAEQLGLRYVVVTSVTRDDLPDGGAFHFVRVIESLHARGMKTEVLIPDFAGSATALEWVVKAQPEVINHNVETVPRLYPEVRPQADYDRSVRLLHAVKDLDHSIVTKSGLMVGLGETGDEVLAVMRDLREAECDLLSIGQYLRPTPGHHPVVQFVPPGEFGEYAAAGRAMGFAAVAAAPLVRSSFRAAELYARAKGDGT